MKDNVLEDMLKEKIEVIYDDRNIRPGAMFSDADLLGIPVKVIVSPRNLGEGVCEVVTRDKEINEKVPVENVIGFVSRIISERLDELNK